DKPMICFAYDYDEYRQRRGMYFDIRKELSNEIISTEDHLIEELLNLDYFESINRTIRFRTKYQLNYGSATAKALDIIIQNI
ncbi:CDP-glycerol glycerophosphotransferase family protein, partial [uncultured Parabacteroides sp.]|uniref:CDP-glycerol glycerophosphotransferase family protein n=1 Tax=uncultured Parabacteroides sp. TaxID=512312 RepID=UPI0025948C43